MAKQTLPVNFKDDILASSMGGKRKYRIIDNGDDTYSFEDVTDYTQTGSDFGAGQINATNQAVNESCDKADVIDDLDDIAANQANGKIAGAKAVATLNKYLPKLYKDGLDYCIRFPGTKIQICFGTMSITAALSQNGTGYTGAANTNHKFVKPFSSLASLQIGNADNNWFWIVRKLASATAIQTVVLGYFTSYPSTTFYVDYMAIGTYSD